jgi:hypothetical protein
MDVGNQQHPVCFLWWTQGLPDGLWTQLSFLDGEAYVYSFFVINTDLSSEEVVDFYQKRGNRENDIKEAKYDVAVGQLLLKSFWSNEAIFQLMMLAYNLFLLFKIDFLRTTE